jgi:hypothetical protein
MIVKKVSFGKMLLCELLINLIAASIFTNGKNYQVYGL